MIEHAGDANLSARRALRAHEVHVIRDSRAFQDEASCRHSDLLVDLMSLVPSPIFWPVAL